LNGAEDLTDLSSFSFLFIFLLFGGHGWIAGDKEKDNEKE